MMAELEVDQSNLPRVQEVCQCFAVLEDGALAHNLQEQEIEQYYTSNVQRNQLVQKDIRVAKSLQDEEKHTARLLQQQTTHQLDECDSEYARMIQEEIQRCAEEARRREVEDEEIAKRIQEEEELCIRSRGSYQNRDARGNTGRNGTVALDLGELEQVLLDEELARRLQEEERLAAETQQGSSPLRGMCPEDFRMAQVAQDEEIARFIQKQEIKAKRRSAELDSVGSRREYRDTVAEYDRRAHCDRQRERMGSDELQSPIDDFTADHQLSSPISMAAQPTRNVAEDLDPTFHRKEINGANQGSQQVGLCNPIEEQPTFVPPTKRHNDKPGRVKSKDKKENFKQKENCKQQ
ncbi:coiled-coil domain-containing protein 187 isoform X3 [Triplophysa rosa]|uniref:coiled-coil domain-containing protein 187 isoform X3 n=1 Tax=Triplophysa rosa TaxID=992332 RepID=UPI0025460CF0|nr:coiled-coil domain-containing protein 187 isoform X3 [Triplophysa rosa]